MNRFARTAIALAAATSVGLPATAAIVSSTERAAQVYPEFDTVRRADDPVPYQPWFDGETLDPSDEQLEAAEASYARDDLWDAAMDHPGFAAVEIDLTNHDILLYWTGEPPSEVHALIGELEDRGLEVVVINVPVSESEIDGAIAQVFSDDSSYEHGFFSLGPAPNFRGLEVSFPEDSPLAELSVEELTDLLKSPVPIVSKFYLPPSSGEPQPNQLPDGALFDTRNNDTGHLDGGSRIRVFNTNPQNFGECGAGVTVFRDSNGQRGMVTAEHCLAGSPNVNAPNGTGRGARVFGSVTRDIGYVAGYNTYNSWIYDGGYGTSAKKAIGDITRPVINEYTNVCMSGALSGSLCSITILQSQLTFRYPNVPGGQMWVDMTYARRLTLPGGAAGGGDSGSPLIRRTWDPNQGRTEARPMGLVTGHLDQYIYNHTNCNGVASVCNHYIYFSGLRDAEIAMDFTIWPG